MGPVCGQLEPVNVISQFSRFGNVGRFNGIHKCITIGRMIAMFKATMKNKKSIYFDDVSEMARKENRLDYASMVEWCTDGRMTILAW